MKQVCVNAATCSCTRRTTSGAALPTVVTAMPDPRSIREFPSASSRMPPPAASTKTGSVVPTPSATYCFLRASFSCDLGPGISVTRLRCWVMELPPASVVLMAAAYGACSCGFHRSKGVDPTDSVVGERAGGARTSPAERTPPPRPPGRRRGHHVAGMGHDAGMPLATYKDLCIDVSDALVSGEYWEHMLGWKLQIHDDGDAHLRDAAGRVQVWMNVVPEPKAVKNRIRAGVNAESLQRALDAGATVFEKFPRWTTLLDPDGQEHCVFVREQVEKRSYELGWDGAEGPEVSHDLASWWQQVIGGAVVDDERGYSWLQDIPECPWDAIDYVGVPEPKTVKNHVHLDVTTTDLDALVTHGATVLRAKGDHGLAWTVLADPAGNEFCAFTD